MAVLNKHHGNIPKDAIFIGRGSIWGNPFPITEIDTRDIVVEKYKRWLRHKILTRQITLEQLASLHNKDFVCYCSPKACHGDVLEKAAKWAWFKLHS